MNKGELVEALTRHKDWHVRRAMAELGFQLAILARDKNEKVREEVAKQGYRLNILVRDRAPQVRNEALKKLKKEAKNKKVTTLLKKSKTICPHCGQKTKLVFKEELQERILYQRNKEDS